MPLWGSSDGGQHDFYLYDQSSNPRNIEIIFLIYSIKNGKRDWAVTFKQYNVFNVFF